MTVALHDPRNDMVCGKQYTGIMHSCQISIYLLYSYVKQVISHICTFDKRNDLWYTNYEQVH